MIKIGVIDNRKSYRSQLIKKLQFEQNIDVVAEADFASEAYAIYLEYRPDIILMEIDLNLSVSIESICYLLQKHPQANIIALTNEIDELFVKESIRAGASAYVLKNAGILNLIEAINTVYKGYSYIDSRVANVILKEFQRLSRIEFRENQPLTPRDLLTKRECEILQLLSSGYSNKAISQSIFLSETTTKNHVSNILSKLNVKDRTQAVVLAIKNGWVELD